MTNDLNLRGDALAALPAGLVQDLRRRADALHRIGSILDHMQQDLWNNGRVVWAPILAVQQDLESLAPGFTGLGTSMSDLADLVGGRQGEYDCELDRLAAEARDVAARSTRAFTVPARDETKRWGLLRAFGVQRRRLDTPKKVFRAELAASHARFQQCGEISTLRRPGAGGTAEPG